MQTRHDVGHFEFTGRLRSRWQQSSNNLSRSGNFYGFAFLNPCCHARKVVPQISDSRCFHRETTMSHASTKVSAEPNAAAARFPGLPSNHIQTGCTLILFFEADLFEQRLKAWLVAHAVVNRIDFEKVATDVLILEASFQPI